MADLSKVIDPWDTSDVASSALAAVSDASSKASEALSRITVRSAVWDRKTIILKALPDDSAVADETE